MLCGAVYVDRSASACTLLKIRVPPQGEDNDHDKYHVAYSWVVVKLRDINDNKPQFERPNIEVSVYENVEVGKSLETFKATDPDQGGKSKVSYAIDRVSDRRRQFRISQEGTVSIQRQLDREETPRHQVNERFLYAKRPFRTLFSSVRRRTPVKCVRSDGERVCFPTTTTGFAWKIITDPFTFRR